MTPLNRPNSLRFGRITNVCRKHAITKKLNRPLGEVWEAIRNIGRLDVWFPIIETCKVDGNGPGATRYMTVAGGGGEIRDTIEEI